MQCGVAMDVCRLNGPFRLLCDSIEDEVVDGCPGAYALGFTDGNNRFCITYVGSAFTDLKSVLRGHIGTAPEFKFRHCSDERVAFELECELFHKFMPMRSFLHPQRQIDSDWLCPHCRRG